MVIAEAPCRALRGALEDTRRAQRDFADVWPHALAGTLATVDDPGERAAWTAALEDTRAAWRAAYERAPATSAGRALLAVADDPDREPVPDATAGICEHCAGAIPAGKRPTVRYCGHACQRAAHGRRVATA